MARVFISHSNVDREQAARLLKWLHGEGITPTVLDFDKHVGTAPGGDWERKLYRELSGADAVILILTKNWFESKWCFVEFAQARALGKAIFPLVESPAGETFVSSDIQQLDLTKDREGGLQRLGAELARIAVNARGGYPWDYTRPPWPGLLAFEEADAAIFFGRDDDIRRVIERLNAKRAQGSEKMLVVLGASGSGKSSLIRAGVVPRLRRDAHNWIVLPPFRPQIHPLDELAQSIALGLGDGANWPQWRAALEGNDMQRALADLARDLRALNGKNEAQILLVIDQGEELFGGADAREAEQFSSVLNALLGERLPFLAVMALRSDYLGRLQRSPSLASRIQVCSLKPMPLDRVRNIIEGPAKVAGIIVDDALIVAASADAPTEDVLPLLAFALRELYDGSAGSGRLSAEAYLALGDARAQLSPLENAVRRSADEVLSAANPSPEDLQALKEAFIPAMVRVNPEGEYVRRPASMAAVSARALPLIESLARARLLTVRQELNASVVEVVHEALLRKWPLLRRWLDEEREFLIGRNELELDLRDWEAAAPKKKAQALLTGLKLARAEAWLAAKPHQLSDVERTFIEASIKGRKRRRRRVFLVIGGIVSAIFLALVVGVQLAGDSLVKDLLGYDKDPCGPGYSGGPKYAFLWVILGAIVLVSLCATIWMRRGSRPAWLRAKRLRWESRLSPLRARELRRNSRILRLRPSWLRRESIFAWLRANKFQFFAVLAIAAVIGLSWEWKLARVRPVFVTQEVLRPQAGEVLSIALSPDGASLVSAGNDGPAMLWNLSTGGVRTLSGQLSGQNGTIIGVAFSPDGQQVASVTGGGSLWTWNTLSGKPVMRFPEVFSYESVAFSPDGKIIAASDNGQVEMWSVPTGRYIGLIQAAGPGTGAIRFSPDGHVLAEGGLEGDVYLLNVSDGSEFADLKGDTSEIHSVAFSSDGKHLATADARGVIYLWNVEKDSPARLKMLAASDEQTVNDLVFTSDGHYLLAASDDGKIGVWDISSGKLLHSLSGHTDAVMSLALSHDGRLLVSSSKDGTIRLWKLKDGQ
jgi:WD40 repeat protein